MSTVYTMTNSAEGNQVIALNRKKDNTLSLMNAFNTLGKGLGVPNTPNTYNAGIYPLLSANSIILSNDNTFLFAVNSGSNTISSFRVSKLGVLTLADVVLSGGIHPNSLAICNDLLYVANAGDNVNASNITGFRVTSIGHLNMIPNSTEALSISTSHPAMILFNPSGTQLIVTESSTNRISVFNVKSDGRLTKPTVNISNGEGPIGAAFHSNGTLFVAESIRNAVSAYCITANGTLSVISGSIESGQLGTSYLSISNVDNNLYASNTAGGSISVYHINNNCTIYAMGNVKSSPKELPEALPIDSVISKLGRNFYVLNSNQGTISSFRIDNNGQLNRIQYLTYIDLPKNQVRGLAII